MYVFLHRVKLWSRCVDFLNILLIFLISPVTLEHSISKAVIREVTNAAQSMEISLCMFNFIIFHWATAYLSLPQKVTDTGGVYSNFWTYLSYNTKNEHTHRFYQVFLVTFWKNTILISGHRPFSTFF